ncbi:DUF4097 family beta strand repeat-containing protein [Streptomyces sp. 891-h]|uniref:DUF4097 family beta strand repeat-containing protein n=1 Tax=Streptomyces sp. 891-h TaxID=2720714 RepID=UPI001FAA3A43|nr:DUF4097 family beta strand repeat-containing protein [Streptomyces sp. 891-h]UNZ17338.1 DUF4097 domain-containing protein [Streptomyces sp. 891-h]
MPVPDDRSWEISEPQRLEFDDPVTELHVRVVNGTVNVVGTPDTTTCVEVGKVKGPPLLVRREEGKLVVAYDDLPWRGFLKWLDRKGWRREAEVSISVPAHAELSVGVVAASAVVSGVRGRTRVAGVSGSTTLVGLSGPVAAETVSGDVETQRLSGALRFSTVSGDLTCIDASAGEIRAESVSGAMILDLCSPRTGEPADIRLSSVSGELAVRLPDDADLTVDAHTTGGAVSSAFDGLRADGWGARRITGTLGAGRGTLQAANVSGGLALLRRPPGEDPLDEDPLDGSAAPEATDRRPEAAVQDTAAASGPDSPEYPGNPSPAKDL